MLAPYVADLAERGIGADRFEHGLDQVRAASAGTSDTPAETIAAWHEQEAGECEASHRWFGAVFHLRRVLELNPQNPEVSARLAVAQGALQQEEQGRTTGRASAQKPPAPTS